MNPDYRPMPDEIRENLLRFARETWRNDGAEGETVHRLCDEMECAVRERNAAEGLLGDATKRARRSESDAAESRAWHQTAVELKKKLVAAEDALSVLRAEHRDAMEVLATVAQVNGYYAGETFPRAITTANRFMATVDEVGKLRTRAEQAEAEADVATVLLAEMVSEHGVEHDDACSGDDDCCCGLRERWLWLTTDRVVLAKNRTDARKHRGGDDG